MIRHPDHVARVRVLLASSSDDPGELALFNPGATIACPPQLAYAPVWILKSRTAQGLFDNFLRLYFGKVQFMKPLEMLLKPQLLLECGTLA